MPIGAGSFVPSVKFAAPRSYWRGVVFNINPYTITNVDNVYTWTKTTDPNETWTVTFDSRFWFWNSNRWTLDFMVTDFYLQTTPGGTKFPQPYELRPHTRPSNASQYIEFRFFSLDFGVLHYRDFPAAPSGYWLPPGL
jgi:hypothetical protein